MPGLSFGQVDGKGLHNNLHFMPKFHPYAALRPGNLRKHGFSGVRQVEMRKVQDDSEALVRTKASLDGQTSVLVLPQHPRNRQKSHLQRNPNHLGKFASS